MALPRDLQKQIRLPIIVAPMFLVSNDVLVMESCKKGVMAAYPFPNSRTIEDLEKWLEKVSSTLQVEQEKYPTSIIAPWIANMIVHSSYERFEQELALIKKYQPKIVITALGSPARVIPTVKEYGGLVFADVSTVAFAKKAIQAGVDGLILLCAGAGGHTGHLNPFAFIREIKKIWNGIIVVSGCINTAREVKAVQFLGADLSYMGTHFIATNESAASQEYKNLVLQSTIDDVITTNVVTGVNANFIKKSLLDANVDLAQKIESKKLEFSERYTDNAPQAWKDIWSAGHGVGGVGTLQSCTQKINILFQEYNSY